MKICVSGVKPTGLPTLGNYIGALKEFVRLQKENSDTHFFVFVANLHALTIFNRPNELRENTKKIAALYLACGLKEENLSLFMQSEILEHNALGFVLESISHIGELKRMTQFKEKSQNKDAEAISAALFTYPSLMAADILLYDADFVPVGDDQKQHLELTRNLAERFNNLYTKTFKIPTHLTPKIGSRIMDLQDPSKKMSKSETGDNKGCIFLLDELDIIKKKIKSAVTDSEAKVKFDPVNKPGVSNLMTIYSSLTEISFKELEKQYENKGYKEFKEDLSEVVVNTIKPIQEKYKQILSSNHLEKVLENGKNDAQLKAKQKLLEVYKKIGIK